MPTESKVMLNQALSIFIKAKIKESVKAGKGVSQIDVFGTNVIGDILKSIGVQNSVTERELLDCWFDAQNQITNKGYESYIEETKLSKNKERITELEEALTYIKQECEIYNEYCNNSFGQNFLHKVLKKIEVVK